MPHNKIKLDMDEAHLSNYAENRAREIDITGSVRPRRYCRQIRRQLKVIQRTCQRASLAAAGRRRIPKMLEWLLDNWYIAEREGLQAAMDLRRAGSLPASGRRVSALALLADSFIQMDCAHVSARHVSLFLKSAQKVRPLTENELGLFVTMLKTALIDRLYALCPEIDKAAQRLRKKKEKSPFEGFLSGEAAENREDVEEISDIFTCLRTLSSLDLSDAISSADHLDEVLGDDPAGIYSSMDERSRAEYRRQVTKMARRRGGSELEAAEQLIAQARRGGNLLSRHIGSYLEPVSPRLLRFARAAYFAVIALFTLLPPVLLFLGCGQVLPALLALVPAMELSKNLTDFLFIRLLPPRHVPRLELSGGIPPEGRTLCVITALLTSEKSGPHFASLLEQYRLSNRDAGEELRFGLLCDLPDAAEKTTPQDERALTAAQSSVDALNARYGGGFYLFLRARTLNLPDRRYMGWERKRGAILQLILMLRGETGNIKIVSGTEDYLSGIKYLITLDADTRLCAGSACQLVGAMLHPSNRPVIDGRRGIVTGGHAVLQPRISPDLKAAGRSLFARITAGQGGIDPYGGAVSDIYHDLFGEGSFTGKGIIEVSAYVQCLGHRFPPDTILSHDLLEGAYLRCGLIGDVELTDGCPGGALSWFARLHRWVRGDWQTAPWLFRRVPGADKEPCGNPVGRLTKWKIMDNLRRSLSPAFILPAMGAALLGDSAGLLLSGCFALLCLWSGLLLSNLSQLWRSRFYGEARYHSSILSGWRMCWVTALVQFLLLPYHAYVSLSAAVTALYRMLVSKRRALQWVTAAQAESAAEAGYAYYYGKMIVMLPAALFAAGGGTPWGIVTACLWLFCPFAARYISTPQETRHAISERDRVFLLREAALMWDYFDTFVSPENHYLPPDNFQEQPATGQARRTSPTNIGLALLCVLSAHDLGLTRPERALELIGRCLDTVERLPKWHGHLLNWYDTATLAPLYPRVVSTVDSGNLAGCLIALTQGLHAMPQAEAAALAQRAQSLEAQMRFSALYDRKRRLFTICYDVERDKPSEGLYDLMASEARQTSYIAIARGEIERRHWARLSRALVGADGYKGMVSWTGTMFEYLMPELLLPSFDCSLLYESMRFCLYCQKKLGAARHTPWGMSESAFYSFDSALNYQYKAHGVSRLGLRRGLGQETVISPYSTFLALPLEPAASLRNLRRLRRLGLEGRYGLYEAADFTPLRLTSRQNFEPVKCFMAHHVGMSLVAVNNALNAGIMQKRFMQNSDMAAFAELLQERVPTDAVTIRAFRRELPEKPAHVPFEGWRQENDQYDAFLPGCTLIGNGSYTLMATDTGLTRRTCAGFELTRFAGGLCPDDPGLGFFLREGQRLIGLTPAPFFDKQVKYFSSLGGGDVKWTALCAGFTLTLTKAVPGNDNAELIEVTVENRREASRSVELVLCAQPVLAPFSEYEAHPAFSRLFIETEMTPEALLVRRRPRADEAAPYLALCCDSGPLRFDTSRETAFGRGGLSSLRAALHRPAQSTAGAVLDPCLFLRLSLELGPGQKQFVRFALSFSDSPDYAIQAARRTLDFSLSHRLSRLDITARHLGLSHADVSAALNMLCDAQFITENRLKRPPGSAAPGQRGLWRFGISGDLPLILCRADSERYLSRFSLMIRRHCLLRQNGFDSDLLLLLDDAGDYRQPMRAVVTDTLRLIGGENTLGQRAGVHIADAGALSAQDLSFLYAAADVVYDYADEFLPEHRRRARRPAPTPPSVPREYPANGEATEGGFPAYEWDDKNEFHFHVRGALPPAAWSHLLANSGFGALVTDAGTGYLWRGNARENKLTPWVNDPLSLCGGETFTLRTKDGVFSLFAGDDGLPCDITYGFGRAVFEKTCGAVRTKLTLFVPPDRMARIALLEVTSDAPVSLRHVCRPVLGPTPSMARHVVTACDGGMLTATNSYNSEFSPQTFFVRAEPPFSRYTCSEASLRQNRFDSLSGAGYDPCLAYELSFPPAEPGRPARAVIVTGCAQNAPGLALLSKLCAQAAARDALERTVSYWDRICRGLKLSTANPDLDRYAGGWAAYQSLCCRVMARTSLYQCGGAYGFRDQLQDVCGLLPFAPRAARTQILRAAAHQFEQGDVQHWWHPGPLSTGQGHKGVRTRCSDDYLWLPYAVCRYVRVTVDEAVLSLEIPWLQAPPLARHEQERYDTPAVTPGRESLYEHCLRACRLALQRGTGRHGLPYIGSGDWNDGYNRVGKDGQGESVWLAYFMAMTLRDMAGLCSRRQDEEESEAFLTFAAGLEEAAGRAWDGNWFIRAYYDDGAPLGAAENRQCQIDSLPQSFAALSGHADRQQVSRALLSALDRLKEDRERLILLFTPPFGGGGPDPGYIRGYLPGVRENGGQYTHAAVWLAAGLMAAGKAREGYEVLDLLLPAGRPEDIYRVEPYVIAADVYSNPAYLGRGGWSWYTGAAGWFLRTVTESLLGIRVESGFLTVRPALSESFSSYRADIRVSGADYHIEADTEGITVNGQPCPAGGVRLAPGSYNVSKLRVENSPGV